MLSEEKTMEILEAYDLTGSFRATAALCGVDHHTVRRYVAARAAGLDPAMPFGRPKVITDPFADKIAEWVERSCGGSGPTWSTASSPPWASSATERTTRRVVARLKRDYGAPTTGSTSPGSPSPALWLQFDYGKGPLVGGVEPTCCSAPGWPGRRFRVILALPDRTFPSVVSALDRTLRMMGGAPTYLLDRQREDGDHPPRGRAGRAQPGDSRVAHYYGVVIHTCVVADPESKGGTRVDGQAGQGRRAAASGQPGGDYPDFAVLRAGLCARPRDALQHPGAPETGERPIDRLALEQAQLHAVPAEPYTVAFGETRTVSWSSLISFQGARYSVPAPALRGGGLRPPRR